MKISVPTSTNQILSYDHYSLWFLTVLLIVLAQSAQTQTTDWELKVDKQGIQIFSRWIEENGQNAREIKADFTVSAPAGQLPAILKDEDHVTDWMVGAKTFRVITQQSATCWYGYTEFDLPWPLQNQDLVALYKVENVNAQTTRVTVEAFPDYREAYPKIERLQHFEASWTFTAKGNGITEVSYRAFTFRKPTTPRWILDPVVQKTLWKTMAGFREVAE